MLSGSKGTGQGAAHTRIVHLNSNLSADAGIYGKQQQSNETVEHQNEGMIGVYFRMDFEIWEAEYDNHCMLRTHAFTA